MSHVFEYLVLGVGSGSCAVAGNIAQGGNIGGNIAGNIAATGNIWEYCLILSQSECENYLTHLKLAFTDHDLHYIKKNIVLGKIAKIAGNFWQYSRYFTGNIAHCCRTRQ